jgi:hypothetical protein
LSDPGGGSLKVEAKRFVRVITKPALPVQSHPGESLRSVPMRVKLI